MKKQVIILTLLFCVASPFVKAHGDRFMPERTHDDLFDDLDGLEAPPLPQPEEPYWFTPYAKNAGIRLFLSAEKCWDKLLALYAACPCIFRSTK